MNVLVPWIAKSAHIAVHYAVDGISPDGLKCAGHVVGMLGMQAATSEHATSVGQGISWRGTDWTWCRVAGISTV